MYRVINQPTDRAAIDGPVAGGHVAGLWYISELNPVRWLALGGVTLLA